MQTEECRSGPTERFAKPWPPKRGPWVQIPPPPPSKKWYSLWIPFFAIVEWDLNREKGSGGKVFLPSRKLYETEGFVGAKRRENPTSSAHKNMKNKNLVIGVVIAILVVGGAYYYQQNQSAGPEAEIRTLVAEFGSKMKNVNLAAPKEEIIKAIQENYGPYISEGLLEGWKMAPERAPGRLTSSPWPDRIEIISIAPTEDGNGYEVQGMVIEITSTEVGTSQPAAQYPVGMIVRNQNGKWLITGFSKAL